MRIRLGSTVVRARNVGDPASSSGVEVAYFRGGDVYTVRARACVLACWNMMIPYLCPELPQRQKEALRYLVKTPLIYANVALRNWTAFKALGISSVYAPGSYFSSLSLNAVVDIGDYKSPRSPDEPMLVRMVRTPCQPGLPERDQNRAGQHDIFNTIVRDFRAQYPRPAGAHPRPGRLRSGERCDGHHRQSLAARLCLRI